MYLYRRSGAEERGLRPSGETAGAGGRAAGRPGPSRGRGSGAGLPSSLTSPYLQVLPRGKALVMSWKKRAQKSQRAEPTRPCSLEWEPLAGLALGPAAVLWAGSLRTLHPAAPAKLQTEIQWLHAGDSSDENET